MQLRFLIIAVLTTAVWCQSQVTQLLAKLSEDVGQLNKTIAAYNGGIGGLLPLGESATLLLNDLKNSAVAIGASPPIDFEDALSLATTVYTLVQNSEQIVDTVIVQKPKFSNVAAKSFVQTTFVSVRGAVKVFGEALKSKLGPEIIPVADKLLQMLDQAFEKGQAAYAS